MSSPEREKPFWPFPPWIFTEPVIRKRGSGLWSPRFPWPGNGKPRFFITLPPARSRPAFSVLDLTESEAIFDIPDWKESLTKVLPEIIYNYEHNIF